MPGVLGSMVCGVPVAMMAASCLCQGGLGLAKKDRRSILFEMALGSGLSKYVIRGTSIFESHTSVYGCCGLGNLKV